MMIDNLPFRQVGVEDARQGGLLCVADHASNHVPEDIDLGISSAELDTHIAVDIGVEGVADRLARRHGMPAHIACVSRLICDLHRTEEDDGVVPTSSDGRLIPGNIGANVEARLARFHRPYHAALADLIRDLKPKLIVALHSFTPKLSTDASERPWEVALLYNNDERAARHAIRMFSQQGLKVGDNEPYSGKQLNATMDRHAESNGIPYCTIEIRQDQISSEAGQARWASLLSDVMGRVAHEVGVS